MVIRVVLMGEGLNIELEIWVADQKDKIYTILSDYDHFVMDGQHTYYHYHADRVQIGKLLTYLVGIYCDLD